MSKYDSAIAEAASDVANDGFAIATTGSVQENGIWYAQVEVGTDPTMFVIIREDVAGFVDAISVTRNRAESDKTWEIVEAEVAEWYDEASELLGEEV